MTFKTLVAGASTAAIAIAAAGAAFAQAPAAAPAAPAIPQGAPIGGLCVFSDQAVLANSNVGKSVANRLQQIGNQVKAELTTEQSTLQNDAKALDGQRGTLDQNTWESRAAALQVRDNALQRKAQQRQKELEATEQKWVGRIYSDMDPLVRQAYQQKGCSILIARQAVMLQPNPAMDITPQVLTALNAKVQTYTFDRERLDAPAATASAPPPTQTPRRQ